MQLAARVLGLSPSPTLAITARAKAMKAAGEKVLSLAAGEPDFPTPEPIRRAAVQAMEAGHTGYTAAAGIPELRKVLRAKVQADLGLEYGDDQVVVCCGAKHCLYNAMQALLNPGDRAILQVPYWVSYPEQVRLAGGEPHFLPMERPGLGLNRAALADLRDWRLRLIVLNSPSNPTGRVLSPEDLDRVADLARRLDLWILSDDIYNRLYYTDTPPPHILVRHPDLRDRTVVINGLSKTYSMTGWRLGWALGPAPIISAMRNLQDQSTSNAVTFVQHAAITALTSPPSLTSEMFQAFAARRHRIVELLDALPGVTCPAPEGAFYAFASFEAHIGRRFGGVAIASSQVLCELLLEHEKVALIPGDAFGAPGFLRFSFACSMETIEQAVERIDRFLRKLS